MIWQEPLYKIMYYIVSGRNKNQFRAQKLKQGIAETQYGKPEFMNRVKQFSDVLFVRKYQGYNARKVNCSCVYSAYILKPVQFSLGGICKQEQMHQYSFSIRGGLKQLIFMILIIHIIVSYDQKLSLIFYVKNGSHFRLRHPYCVYITAKRQCTAVQKMRTLLKQLSLHYNLGKYHVTR